MSGHVSVWLWLGSGWLWLCIGVLLLCVAGCCCALLVVAAKLPEAALPPWRAFSPVGGSVRGRYGSWQQAEWRQVQQPSAAMHAVIDSVACCLALRH